MSFAELHNQHEPLLITNVWDAASAIAAQEAGYQVLGTSSAAIASTLGYEDGQGMPFDELFYMVTRIRAVSNLPLSVDMEAGYGDSAEEQRLMAWCSNAAGKLLFCISALSL
jgi:2-methylisocitrate lyase-like PEP mutase family enzyme